MRYIYVFCIKPRENLFAMDMVQIYINKFAAVLVQIQSIRGWIMQLTGKC